MQAWKNAWIAVAASLLMACGGCPSSKSPQPSRPSKTPAPGRGPIQSGETVETPGKSAPQPEQPPAPVAPKPVEKPAPATIPKVRLTDTLRATCLVKIGDAMPDAELADLQGKPQAIRALVGPKLTVVCFFAGGSTDYSAGLATDMLKYLERDLIEPYEAQGLRVVAIDVGDRPDAAQSMVAKAAVKMPVLLDPQGEYYRKLATQKPPRIYVLDAAGKILWFDLEYSRASRRELQQAVDAVLGQPPSEG